MGEEKVLYKKLSFDIVGCCYEVFNELGPELKEKVYQKALAFIFEQKKIPFEQQKFCTLKFKAKRVGDQFIDFVIDKKIVLEIKVSEKFRPADFQQIKSYLIANNIELGILVRFSLEGVVFCRILKPFDSKKFVDL